MDSSHAQDGGSSKSAFASVPTALLARKAAFSAEGKLTKDELMWLSVCSDIMRQESVWSCADDGACQTWHFALVLVGSVCQRVREQWASIGQWASDEEKSVIATFLDASVLFAFRACATVGVFQDGFCLLSVLCCNEYKPFEPNTCLVLPVSLMDPQNPINALMAASPLGALVGNSDASSAPLTDSIEQILAQSMGPCTTFLSSSASDAQSFVSRCMEAVAKHEVVKQLLELIPARSDSDFVGAALSFLASAKACLTSAHVPFL